MSWSRREFLRNVSLAGGAWAAAAPVLSLAAPVLSLPTAVWSAPGAGAVLSFHLDHPYVDPTGEARAYVPPAGARGGAPLAALNDAEMSRYYGSI